MSRIGGKDTGTARGPSSDELRESTEGHGEAQRGVDRATGGQPKKVTAADAERMASQAGFVRSGAKKKGQGLDLGDASRGPIPLPEDDVDTSEWSNEGLTAAQSELLGHTVRLGRGKAKARGGLKAAFAAIVGGLGGEGGAHDDAEASEDDDAATAERRARLQALVEQSPPAPPAMAALAKSVQTHFGIDIAGAPAGAALVATSLLVAGHAENVQVAAVPGAKELVADNLMDGLQRVVEEGRAATDDARRRTEGVSRAMALQRTFVPKR